MYDDGIVHTVNNIKNMPTNKIIIVIGIKALDTTILRSLLPAATGLPNSSSKNPISFSCAFYLVKPPAATHQLVLTNAHSVFLHIL